MKYSQEIIDQVKEVMVAEQELEAVQEDGSPETVQAFFAVVTREQDKLDGMYLEYETEKMGGINPNRFWDTYEQIWNSDKQKME